MSKVTGQLFLDAQFQDRVSYRGNVPHTQYENYVWYEFLSICADPALVHKIPWTHLGNTPWMEWQLQAVQGEAMQCATVSLQLL